MSVSILFKKQKRRMNLSDGESSPNSVRSRVLSIWFMISVSFLRKVFLGLNIWDRKYDTDAKRRGKFWFVIQKAKYADDTHFSSPNLRDIVTSSLPLTSSICKIWLKAVPYKDRGAKKCNLQTRRLAQGKFSKTRVLRRQPHLAHTWVPVANFEKEQRRLNK